MIESKIIFTGPVGVGKTTAIAAISDEPPIQTDARASDMTLARKANTTVAMDYGVIRLDESTKVHLYGTPGQERFDFMWEILSQGSIGLILIGIGLMTKPEPALVSGLCYLLLSIPSALYAYFLRKQGAVFVLNEQYLEYQSKAGGDYQRHSLDEIAEIRYLVSPVYRGYQSKRLRIVGNKGALLAVVNLNKLDGADFNGIYHFVEQVAPYIKWDFSNS